MAAVKPHDNKQASDGQTIRADDHQNITTTSLDTIISHCAPCQLTPAYLFISWQGVLTLAYRGLPAPLEALKHDLHEAYPALPAENPGARWPKTTLGCLRDTARLTSVQFGQLKALCQDVQRQLIAVDTVGVQSVDLVVYECRSLERTLSTQTMQLAGTSTQSGVRAEAVAAVDRVIREWDEDDYWFHASKDGNREAHYRGVRWSAMEHTYTGAHSRLARGRHAGVLARARRRGPQRQRAAAGGAQGVSAAGRRAAAGHVCVV